MEIEYPRWQAHNIKQALQQSRIVAVSGSRQSGKTTIARQVMNDNFIFRSLDRVELLQSAKNDPHEFVQHTGGTMIIDESQKVPGLFSEIKLAVDSNNRAGQFLLTGSTNLYTTSKMGDSLAGRIRHIRLRPLTMGEILQRQPSFLQRAFSCSFPINIKGYDKEKIFDLAFNGGFPEIWRLERQKAKREWHHAYMESILNKDLYEVEKIRRRDMMSDLVKILAGWSGRYMDKAKIRQNLEISKSTLDIYLNALVSLYIFEYVPPWTRTDYEYVGRKAKIFATDTGLMTTMLNWQRDDVRLNADRSGKLMETFVFQELSAQINLDSDYTLYQYRDMQKKEIDFLVEKAGSNLLGIEVKASRTVSNADFQNLRWFKEKIAKDKINFMGLVLYSGEDTLSFGNNMLAVPIASLWDQ